MTATTIVYLVLSFNQPHLDSVPQIDAYDDVQKACEVASHTIYPSTVWMEQYDNRTQCCDDSFTGHEYRDRCKQDPNSFELSLCPKIEKEITKMRCVSSPIFKLEVDK